MMTPRYGGGLEAALVLLQLSPLLSAAEAAVVVEMTMTTSMTTMIMWSTTLSMVSGRRERLSGLKTSGTVAMGARRIPL